MIHMFFGDSHSRQFVGTSWGIFAHYIFSGATIKGLSNNNSTTGHAKIIDLSVSNKLRKQIFLMLGHVDLDFTLIRDLCSNPSLDISDFIQKRIEIYVNFVYRLQSLDMAIENIFILGPQISPLRNNYFFKSTALQINCEPDLIQDTATRVCIDDATRAAQVIYFNDQLSQAINVFNKVHFLRIDKKMVDRGNLILEHFIANDKADHHANISQTQKLWHPLLNDFIKEKVIVG
ncbi:hypothetical protein [Acidisoma silvae]|uniref:Uncharacterized protein n=1 Tax=Acidisoma silvae TaxID=2802396 RepID=A0A963YUY1_9PROT|nr:hypothetical protein [Acidisoma silvae]MCB8877567.1 hypothetical protein [Acidisoma silvae]